MDEKMKDAVKITVIATGFREVPTARNRQHQTHDSFASAHAASLDDDFPAAPGPRAPTPEPERIMSGTAMVEATMTGDRVYEDDAPVAHASDRTSADMIPLEPSRDLARAAVLSNMSSITSNMAPNFEADDLDVPAFLRKRNEVM